MFKVVDIDTFNGDVEFEFRGIWKINQQTIYADKSSAQSAALQVVLNDYLKNGSEFIQMTDKYVIFKVVEKETSK